MTTEAGISGMHGSTAARWVGGDDPDTVRQRWLLFWFYFGVPLALGFLLGWLQVGRAADWPRHVSLVYWIGASLAMTPSNALATALLSALLRRLRSPLWLTLFFGQILAGFAISNPVLQAWRTWMQGYVSTEIAVATTISLEQFLQRLPTNTLMWVGICLLFFYGLRMPLFGYRPRPRPRSASAAPVAGPADAAASAGARLSRFALLERVRPERRGALLALKAEGHYLQVYTDAGSDLILYRLADAMLEMANEDGAQVHRSWWVAARAISDHRHRDHLQLCNGIEVPVSRSFRVTAQQRGWLTSGAGS